MPATTHMTSVVRDLWILWLKHVEKPKFQFEPEGIHGGGDNLNPHPKSNLLDESLDPPPKSNLLDESLEYSTKTFRPFTSLILIHLGAYILKTTLTIGDLYRICVSTTFPYFSGKTATRPTKTKTGGYPGLPRLTEFHKHYHTIFNHLTASGLYFESATDHPPLTFKLFKHLQLCPTFYLHFKTVAGILGTRKSHNLHPLAQMVHIAVCVIFVARTVLDKVKLEPQYTPSSFLWRKRVPPGEGWLIGNGCTVVAQVKKEFETSVLNVFERVVCGRTSASGSNLEETPRIVDDDYNEQVDDDYNEQQELHALDLGFMEPSGPTRDLSRVIARLFPSHPILKKGPRRNIRSYLGNDPMGAKDVLFTRLVYIVSGVLGLDPEQLVREIRKADEILYGFSVTLVQGDLDAMDTDSEKDEN